MFPSINDLRDTQTLPGDLDVLKSERPKRRALIIDDESDTVTLLKYIMSKAGIDATFALDGPSALELVAHIWPDVILLDLMMPGMDGWEIYQELRRLTNAPVMIVSALNDKEDVVRGLRIGADDYIIKPFYPSELLARINRVTSRRKAIHPLKVFKFSDNDLEIDSNTREVSYAGKVTILPPREFGVLGALARRPGQWVDLSTIATEVWGDTNVTVQNRIKYLVFLLRSHLEIDPGKPRLFMSREGLGYKLAVSRGTKNSI